MRDQALAVPFLLLLFILPFPGTVALRLLCLAVVFIIAMSQWRRRSPPAVQCKLAIGLWAAVALLSLVFAIDPGYSLSEIKNELGYALMAFIAFFVVTRDERDMELPICAALLSATMLCVWVLTQSAFLGFWDDASGHGGAGDFATYAVTILPVVMLAGSHRGAPWVRRAAAAVLALLLATAFYSHQRSIWPIFVLQVLVPLWLLRGHAAKGSKRVVVLASLALIAIAGAALVYTQLIRHEDAGAAVEIGSDSRLAKWVDVTRRIAERPFHGSGFGRLAMAKGDPDLVSKTGQFWHAHNTFLNYGLGMGLPGIVVLLFLFYCLARQYWLFVRIEDRWMQFLGAAGLMLVLGVFLRNQVNDSFVRHMALLFWALNGMFLGAGLRRLQSAA